MGLRDGVRREGSPEDLALQIPVGWGFQQREGRAKGRGWNVEGA